MSKKIDLSVYDQHVQPEPQEEQDPGKLESLLRGAAQGASLGFADEITGGLESLLTNKSYEQARDESRKAYDAAQEANPATSFAGNLVGGLLTPIPGATEAGLVGHTLQGAGMGAVAALGASNKDITNPDILNDVGMGTLIGGGLGAAGKAVSSGLGALKGSNLNKGLQQGLEGNLLVGDQARKAVGKELVDTSGNIAGDVQKLMENRAAQKGDILRQADESGKKLSIEDLLNFSSGGQKKLPKSFTSEGDSARKALSEPLERLGTEGVSPSTLDDFRKAMGRLGYEKDLKDTDIVSLAKQISGKSGEQLNTQIPGLAKTNEDISSLMKVQDIFNTGKGMDELGNEVALTPLVQKLENNSVSSDIARAKFDEAVNTLKQVDPDLGSQIEQKASKIADKYQLTRDLNKETPLISNPIEVARRFGAKAANVAGYGASKAKGPIPAIANKMMNYEPQYLANLATKLEKSNNKFAPVVRKLVDAEEPKRKAIMFSLMQQPSFRQLINTESDNEE